MKVAEIAENETDKEEMGDYSSSANQPEIRKRQSKRFNGHICSVVVAL